MAAKPCSGQGIYRDSLRLHLVLGMDVLAIRKQDADVPNGLANLEGDDVTWFSSILLYTAELQQVVHQLLLGVV